MSRKNRQNAAPATIDPAIEPVTIDPVSSAPVEAPIVAIEPAKSLVVVVAPEPAVDPLAAWFDVSQLPRRRGSVISAAYKKSHVTDSLADDVHAFVFNGADTADLGRLAMLADANNLDVGRWAHLNVGMRIMNLTNVLRGRQRRNEPVTIPAEPDANVVVLPAIPAVEPAIPAVEAAE